MEKSKIKKDIQELNELYEKADQADKKVFAEMRSNILLVSGEHYKKVSSRIDRGLEQIGVNKDKRLRLTKNHTQKITSDLKDIFLSQASSFKAIPRNEAETSDTKAAEIANSVWMWGADKIEWDDMVDRQVNSFVDIGEVGSKIFHDPNKGDIKGYAQALSEEGMPLFKDAMGQPTTEPKSVGYDDMGQLVESEHEPLADKSKPVFSGQTIIEKLYAFNLLRCPSAQRMKDSPYLIYRHMKSIKDAKLLAKDEETKAKITEGSNKTYKIFDSTTGDFYDSKDQVMFREFYFRPCHDYPRGYYFITTDMVIIDEGEIPFGDLGEIAFPIKHAGYDIIETSPRYSSPIRPLRPYQAEINRTASAISETQITLGADKLILKTGGALSKGVEMSGMRSYHVSGPDPMVIPGRSGDQYVSHLQNQIQEMYQVARIPENVAASAQVTDIKAELFKSVKQKSRFTRQQARLERFFEETIRTWLFLAQKYMSDEDVVRAAGRKEAVNVAEFKGVSQLDFAVKIEPVSGDFDTMFGKLTELEIIAQYFGKDLPLEVKASLIRAFPHMNKEPALMEMMVDYESPLNACLALDRGEDFIPNKRDDEIAMLKRLTLRTRESDFKLLDPMIQQKYEMVMAQYEEIAAQKAEEALRVTKGMIPTGGNLVKCDFYIMNESGKQERATLPQATIDWVMKAIEAQGMAQDRLSEIHNSQVAGSIANQMPDQAFPNNQEFLNQQTTIPMGGM